LHGFWPLADEHAAGPALVQPNWQLLSHSVHRRIEELPCGALYVPVGQVSTHVSCPVTPSATNEALK
jgi:hypothetical protein